MKTPKAFAGKWRIARREDFVDGVRLVRVAAPSDGTLFDELRYMLQQEEEPWGMSTILAVSDMTVESVDTRMEPALERILDEDLRGELAAFCDTFGRCARAWQWKGKDRRHLDGRCLSFVAGIYDGEGVRMHFDVFRIEGPSS